MNEEIQGLDNNDIITLIETPNLADVDTIDLSSGVLWTSTPSSTYNVQANGSWAVTSPNIWNSSYNSVNITSNNTLSVQGPGADIKINEKSMSDWMSTVEKRLAILVPKPELLEKYKALQQAYDHYKTLEALLYDNERP